MELVIFIGIPASGKSTESQKYRDMGYEVLSSDAIRGTIMHGVSLAEVSKAEQDKINAEVFETIRVRTHEALQNGHSVVMDATNLNRRLRMEFLEQFRKYPCKKRCVLFITPADTCLERNRRRTGTALVPEHVMHWMLSVFECPYYWEGWDEITPVIADEPCAVPPARPRLSAEYSEAVKEAAQYHDVAKGFTEERCENYSAYLYLTAKCCGKTLSAEEFRKALYVANLINCRTLKEPDAACFGEDFLCDLMALQKGLER